LRTPAGLETCEAALLLGADGVESTVRRLTHIPVQRHDYGQTAIVANIEVANARPHTAFERFTSSGPLALLPLGPHRQVLVRCARNADVPALLALSEADYLTDTAARFGAGHGAFSACGPRRAHPLLLCRAERLTGPRTLLLGNAANTLHPNAAQGLNLGLRDVAAVLELLDEATLRGGDPGEPALLARYAAARHADHRATVQVTDTLARLFAAESSAVGVLRAAAMIAADRLPIFKRLALQRLALGQGVWS